MARALIKRLTWRTGALIVIEHLLIVLAVVLAAAVRLGWADAMYLVRTGSLLWRSELIAAVLQVCLHYCDLYDLRILSDRRELLVGLMQALGTASLFLAFLYYWIPSLVIGRGVFLVSAAMIIALVAGWRLAF